MQSGRWPGSDALLDEMLRIAHTAKANARASSDDDDHVSQRR
jgi:hypothetical protein